MVDWNEDMTYAVFPELIELLTLTPARINKSTFLEEEEDEFLFID